MKINYFGILCGVLAVLSSCDDAMEGNLPAEYSTVMYLKETGVKNVSMINADGDKIYRLTICKGGNTPGETASAKVVTMSEEELNLYNDKYSLLPEDCYMLPEQLDFKRGDSFRQGDIVLKTSEIVKLVQNAGDDANEYVLPLLLTSEENKISDKSNMVILKPVISSPEVSVNSTALQTGIVYTKEQSQDELLFNFEFLLNTDNKWSFTCGLEDDENELQKLVDSYNTSKGTEYTLLPKSSYKMETVSFEKGSGYVDYSLAVMKSECNSLNQGDYLLPVKIKEISLPFSFDSSVRYVLVSVKNSYGEIDLTGKLSSNSEHNESQSVDKMTDNDKATFWQSTWDINRFKQWQSDNANGIENNTWDETFGNYVDIQLDESYSVIQFAYQNRELNNSVPAVLQLYGSSDGTTWTAISNELKRTGNSGTLPEGPSEWFYSNEYSNVGNYTMLRLSVKKSYDKSANATNEKDLCNPTSAFSVSIAELKLMGLKSSTE